jgi:cytochrome c-type biogenesis protein CcmH/NrfG
VAAAAALGARSRSLLALAQHQQAKTHQALAALGPMVLSPLCMWRDEVRIY